jgi:chromosome segregation ATPase
VELWEDEKGMATIVPPKKVDNIKEEETHDMENLRKNNENETEIQNTMEGHFSRLEQVEDRISELENKTEVKGKTEDLLVKQLKTCKRHMQELNDSIKRPNLRIKGVEEGEEMQIKGFHNVVNKAITENTPNLEKVMPIQVQEALKVKRAWSEVIRALNESNFNPRILHPAKLSNKINGATKILNSKQKLRQYMATKPQLQKTL